MASLRDIIFYNKIKVIDHSELNAAGLKIYVKWQGGHKFGVRDFLS